MLAALPKSAHPGAKKALAEIWNAEDKRHARDAVTTFDAAYGAKFPKATAKVTDDVEVLLAFSDYPAEHWIHLRTTDEIVKPSLGVVAVFSPSGRLVWCRRPWTGSRLAGRPPRSGMALALARTALSSIRRDGSTGCFGCRWDFWVASERLTLRRRARRLQR